jgi:hypothetical protein
MYLMQITENTWEETMCSSQYSSAAVDTLYQTETSHRGTLS